MRKFGIEDMIYEAFYTQKTRKVYRINTPPFIFIFIPSHHQSPWRNSALCTLLSTAHHVQKDPPAMHLHTAAVINQLEFFVCSFVQFHHHHLHRTDTHNCCTYIISDFIPTLPRYLITNHEPWYGFHHIAYILLSYPSPSFFCPIYFSLSGSVPISRSFPLAIYDNKKLKILPTENYISSYLSIQEGPPQLLTVT